MRNRESERAEPPVFPSCVVNKRTICLHDCEEPEGVGGVGRGGEGGRERGREKERERDKIER